MGAHLHLVAHKALDPYLEGPLANTWRTGGHYGRALISTLAKSPRVEVPRVRLIACYRSCPTLLPDSRLLGLSVISCTARSAPWPALRCYSTRHAEDVRNHRRPLLGGDRAGQKACPALSSGNLQFPAADITNDGDGATRPATPHPLDDLAHRLGIFGRSQNNQSNFSGGGVEQHILRPAVGDQAAPIHLRKLLACLRRFGGATADHHDAQSLPVPRAFPLTTRPRHSAPSLQSLLVQPLCQRQGHPHPEQHPRAAQVLTRCFAGRCRIAARAAAAICNTN